MAKRRGNGEGSITKRKKDGRWQGYVMVGYDPDTGRPKKKYFYGKTRKEVQDRITEALGKIKTGTYQEPTKLKVAEWLNTWIDDYMKPSLRTTTWESYKMQVDKHILPYLGHYKLVQLQTSHLQKLYNDKLAGNRSDGKKGGLSPRSVRYIHQVIHGALEQAKKEGIISVNVAGAAKLPRDVRKEIQYFTTAEMKTFIVEAKKSPRHFPAYLLALNTGIRRGELLALRWQDVDFNEGSITINQGLVRTKQGLKFQEPKTKLSNRTIGLSREMLDILKLHKKRQNEEKLRAGTAYEDNNLVFCNELGQPLCPRGLTRHFERLLKRSKLKMIPFHGLRHTFATLSLQEGADPKTISEALGHHSVAFTLEIYSSVTLQMKKEASNKMGGLLASCLNG